MDEVQAAPHNLTAKVPGKPLLWHQALLRSSG